MRGDRPRSRAPRKELAQHFLRRGALARSLVARTGLGPGDRVLEIGAGTGVLTEALAERGARIDALELDPELCGALRRRFAGSGAVRVRQADASTAPLPRDDYTVVGNLPFALTTALLRRLVEGEHPPRDVFAIVQREAALRYAGSPWAPESRTSLSWKPWWHIEILQDLRRTDFEPPPRVDSVLLWLGRRERGLVPAGERSLYRDFVASAFGRRGNTLSACCRSLLTSEQLKRGGRALRFSPGQRPSELAFEQWLGLYRIFAWHGGEPAHTRVRGAQRKLPRRPAGEPRRPPRKPRDL